jgi:hypothetical protein
VFKVLKMFYNQSRYRMECLKVLHVGFQVGVITQV